MTVEETVRRYSDLAVRQCHGLYIRGGERADIEQEALIGLLAAHRDYDARLGVPFRAFAVMVVRRHLVTVVKTANRPKRHALDAALRVGVNEDGVACDIVDMLPARDGDPERTLLNREELRRLTRGLSSLSSRERQVVLGIASGVTYAELGGSAKAVDNTNQRARQKLREAA